MCFIGEEYAEETPDKHHQDILQVTYQLYH
jgi:hypothetical protein